MEKDMSFFVPTDFAWIMEIQVRIWWAPIYQSSKDSESHGSH